MFSSEPQVTERRSTNRFLRIKSSFDILFRTRLRNKIPVLLTLPAILLVIFSVARINTSTEIRNPQFVSSDTDDYKDFVCLFTTFKAEERKMQVYQNVLYNCKALSFQHGRVRCIFYDTTLSAINWNDTVEQSTYEGHKFRPLVTQKLVDIATAIGWDVVVLPRVSPYDGLPYFKDMYLETAKRYPKCKFSTFVNADIMFGDGLMPTLDAIDKVVGLLEHKMLLLIGKRTGVNMDSLSARIFSPNEVNRIAVGHSPIHGYAQDYFFVYKNNFPWDVVPNIVVGRVAYDNFIVAKAYQTNVSVIDLTPSVVAVHQSTSKDGGERKNRKHGGINKAIIGPFNYYAGNTNSAPYLTTVEKNTTAVNVYRRCGKGCLHHVADGTNLA